MDNAPKSAHAEAAVKPRALCAGNGVMAGSSPSLPAIPGTGTASLHLAFPSVTAQSTGIIIQIDDRAPPEKCSSHAPPVKFMHMVLFDQEILYYILIDRIPERSHRMRYGGL